MLAAADIGGTKISLSLADAAGIRLKLYQPTRRAGGPKTVPDQVIELVRRACAALGIDTGRIEALGVCAASPFEMCSGQRELVTLTLCGGIERADSGLPNDWTSIPLERELGAAFPCLRIENDCVAAVIAERLFGAGRGEDDLAYVTWSTGVGAGAFVDGHLLRGKNGNAMHLGYLLPPAGMAGGRLEGLVGGPALERRYGAPVAEIFAACRAGEPRARALVRWAAGVFAAGLVSLTCLLDTRLIVVGGSIALHHWDILAPLLETRYREFYPVLTREALIRPSALGEHLGDIAALSLVMPEQWVAAYREAEPWSRAPAPIVLPPDH